MNIAQNGKNGIIKWDDFSIGANAAVNFTGDTDHFNTLNYVTGSNMSQIYGKMNANNNGNIYLVNPNGVQIGNSAQINVGSLYVSTKKIDDIDNINKWNSNTNIEGSLRQIKTLNNAELMSLGYVTANKVTFEGKRVIIDIDRLQTPAMKSDTDTPNIHVVSIRDDTESDYATTKSDNRLYDVVLGSSDGKSAAWENKIDFRNVRETDLNAKDAVKRGDSKAQNPVNADETLAQYFTYRWIKSGEELSQIGKKGSGYELNGHYALRNALDLTNQHQTPLGNDINNPFTGKFDGLGYNIFGLSVGNETTRKDYAGLFGYTDGAIISHVNLIAGTDGTSIYGNKYTGALIGYAKDTQVRNVTSTLKVEGNDYTGGLIGCAEQTKTDDTMKRSILNNLINTGTIEGNQYVGGIVGYMKGGTLGVGERGTIDDEETHNLGKITGTASDVGGLVGHAENAVIGGIQNVKKDATFTNNTEAIYNGSAVEGAYNVGGIVGSATNTTIQNVRNESTVTATGFTKDAYTYHNGSGTSVSNANIHMANAGGVVGTILSSTINDALNKGNISSKEETYDGTNKRYQAGNVGGIAGKANNTNMTNVTNQESNIRGAMNVGGVVGYYGNSSTDQVYRIQNGQNDGGDISATGGIDDKGFATEQASNGRTETYTIGNIGGIVGMMSGNAIHIEGSVNRGNVHTPYITGNTVPETAKAANVGGIAGKIDEPFVTKDGKQLSAQGRLNAITKKVGEASISGSANNGNVEGFVNIGGITGFSFNGSVASSYNLGNITTTRTGIGDVTLINLGGILGDSTEQGVGRAVLYDVYNKGQIGSQEYTKYYGRHVGGIAGRFSGIIDKAYNTGDIYNGSSVVGGIVGYWYNGAIWNVFNTGNITVYNQNPATSEVGGIIGAASLGGGNDTDGTYKAISLSQMYNLGVLRSYKAAGWSDTVGGIIGEINPYGGHNNGMTISDGYTLGRLYYQSGQAGAIVGNFKNGTDSNTTMKNLYYIESNDTKSDGQGVGFVATDKLTVDLKYKNNGYTVISAAQSKNQNSYGGLQFSTQKDGKVDFGTGHTVDDTWRMVEGSTLPILNAFLPGSESYFSDKDHYTDLMNKTGNGTLQYGTEYNPLLTIIRSNSNDTLTFNWKDLDLKNNGSIAVIGNENYTPNLTLNDMHITNPTGIFGGEIYTTGTLTINGDGIHDMQFGGGSTLHAGSVFVDAKGKVLDDSGEIHAVGKSGNTELGDVTLKGGEVNLYGIVKSSKDSLDSTDTIRIPGISGVDSAYSPTYWDSIHVSDFIADGKLTSLTNLGQLYSLAIDKNGKKNGDLNITADGNVNILYGNQKNGRTEVGGNLNVTSDHGDIYMDSDYTIGHEQKENTGKLNFKGNKNIILDLTNIGGQVTGDAKAKAIQSFLTAHSTKGHGITADNSSDSEGIKIAIDAWDSQYKFDGENKEGNFNYKQYDYTDTEGNHGFLNALWKLSVMANGTSYGGPNGTDKTGEVNSIHDIFYTFISNAEQLNGIQHYAEHSPYSPYNPAGSGEFDILHANFLLKNDIDASGLETYETIASGKNKDGTDQSYTGTFDGLGNRIIGLTAKKGLIANNGGNVQNLEIYSSVFTGENAGAVASKNTGAISNITGLGNSITGTGSIGGMVGMNHGSMENLEDQSTVIAGENTIAGGLAGTNYGSIFNAQTNSAVTTNIDSTDGKASQMGGIVGVNYDRDAEKMGISNVSAHGVTGKESHTETAGGIVGANHGTISEAYNESVLNGSSGIGGIAGINQNEENSSEGKKIASISNVANAMEIIGDAGSQNVGGLVGNQQSGTISDGRNTGTISGGENVGGMVGTNGKDSKLNNLENGSVAKIMGVRNVGGIAGVNEGTISAENQSTLLNKGEIYGWENVGGIAGKNSGIIENVNSDIYLHIIGQKEKANLRGTLTGISDNAQYFGGVTGENVGTITNATNRATVDAAEATYVGGIVGRNTKDGTHIGTLQGMGNSNQGKVIGKNYVGGVIGKNEVEIKGTETDGVGVTNSGTVIATAGGAGGIIGENDANITYAVMKNEGEVHGNASEDKIQENGTGGIIGVNGENASITNSSMMNTLKGEVTGSSNVGGIIGINHGTVTGGRDSKDGYYQHQIYNNGTIQAGSYKNDVLDTNGTGSTNIGGLIGDNQGSLTAGYNTGVISAKNSTNVGGIAGTNSGTIDQVFTNVMTENGQKQTIEGQKNVGGIVGKNDVQGKISNAYTDKNTTVIGATSGLIAGTNGGTISNVYGAQKDKLVGNGTVTNGYGLSHTANDYNGFDFTGNDSQSAVWKIYEDRTNPLLKVFLTKADVKKDALENLTYNGENQLDINKLISNKTLTNQKDADFADFTHSSSLLQSNASKNAGTYTNWLWSAQIGTNTDGKEFDPNNLGYDFIVGNVDIAKAKLSITLDDIYRIYGNKDELYTDNNHNIRTSYDAIWHLDDTAMSNEMKSELKNGITVTKKSDKAVDDLSAGKDTNHVGNYDLVMNVTLADAIKDNYDFNSTVTKTDGSHVDKANLTINLNDVFMTYGDAESQHSPKYSYDVSNEKGQNLVNGDTLQDVIQQMTYENTGFDGDKTKDAGGGYKLKKSDVMTGSRAGNYNISYHDGNVTIAKKTLTAKDFAASIVYGNQDGKGWQIDKNGALDGVVYNDDVSLNWNQDWTEAGKYLTNKNGRDTADRGTYIGDMNVTGISLKGTKAGNYTIASEAQGDLTVTKAKLNITVGDARTTYGQKFDESQYGYTLNGNTNGDSEEVVKGLIGQVGYTNSAAKNGTKGKWTDNAGIYTGAINLNKKVDQINLKNYEVGEIVKGTANVDKATLNLTVGDANTTYGTKFDESRYGYSLNGNTNGDSEEMIKDLIGSVSYINSAAKDGTNGKWTADAGKYIGTIDLSNISSIDLKNYNVGTITKGTAMIKKAPLHVHTDDQTITVGQKPKYTGTLSKLVNGDSEEALGKLIYGIDDAHYEQTAGTYIGVIRTVNGKYGELPSSYYKNYEITYDWGNLIVKPVDAPQFDYLFYDTPWDKQRNFRERRAELHFVDGGVHVG